MYSVDKLRTYLLGTRFTIITDHKGLVFLNTTQFLNSRLIRYSLLLQLYDFEVEYCKGADNKMADFFSRNPDGHFESGAQGALAIDVIDVEGQTDDLYDCSIVEMHGDLRQSLKNLVNLQRQDNFANGIIVQLDNGRKMDFFILKEDILFRLDPGLNVWQVVIPEILTKNLIDCIHSKLGHPGVFKTNMYIRRFYFWKSMSRQIKKFILSCDLCQRVKSPNEKMIGPYGRVLSEGPSDLVSVDFYGPLPKLTGGMEYIFVILDVFSKYIKLYPIKKEKTEVILGKLFNKYIPEMGKPNRVISDHGSQFTSPKWKNRLRKEGIKVIFSSVRHPQGNPVERVMRELGRLFRTLCADKHTRWVR